MGSIGVSVAVFLAKRVLVEVSTMRVVLTLGANFMVLVSYTLLQIQIDFRRFKAFTRRSSCVVKFLTPFSFSESILSLIIKYLNALTAITIGQLHDPI